MKLLETAHQRHPTDRDILAALISMAQETGDPATALRHARALSALNPTDIQLHMLVIELEKRQAR